MESKVIAVTGAASGIGRATAVILAERGVAGLALSDVDQAGLSETEQMCQSLFVLDPHSQWLGTTSMKANL